MRFTFLSYSELRLRKVKWKEERNVDRKDERKIMRKNELFFHPIPFSSNSLFTTVAEVGKGRDLM